MADNGQDPEPDRRGVVAPRLIPRMRGTRGSLPEALSQPVDPGGVGGFNEKSMQQFDGLNRRLVDKIDKSMPNVSPKVVFFGLKVSLK